MGGSSIVLQCNVMYIAIIHSNAPINPFSIVILLFVIACHLLTTVLLFLRIILLFHYASVCMRSKAYGSHFVCVCVCSERICFFRGLWAKVSVSTDIILCCLSLKFADLQNKASFLRYGNICLPRRLL